MLGASRVLNEQKASGVLYDPATDVLRVLVRQPPGTVRTRTLTADLLLDATGFLVGLDVEPESPGRVILMLGPHDRVERRASAAVGVCSDASGAVSEVRVGGARASVRGHDKNPYA